MRNSALMETMENRNNIQYCIHITRCGTLKNFLIKMHTLIKQEVFQYIYYGHTTQFFVPDN